MVKKKLLKKPDISQIRALANRTPVLGRVGQAAWELLRHKLGSVLF